MRTIKRPKAFKRDYKRVKATPNHRNDVDGLLTAALVLLVNDTPLPEANRDHSLSGNWSGYRDCHLKPDLLLIYQNNEDEILKLVRLGSHSELFG